MFAKIALFDLFAAQKLLILSNKVNFERGLLLRQLLYSILIIASPTFGWGWDSFAHYPPMKEIYHPTSTSSPSAQAAFDCGLMALYGFNYDAANMYFERAAKSDPEFAMAYWGKALALDAHLTRHVSAQECAKRWEVVQKAVELAEKHSSARERAYIDALAARFSKDPADDKIVLRRAYRDAMKKVVAAYPDDLDAAVFYAESMMDLVYWNPWKSTGAPREGADEIIQTLESVLKRNPLHIGANHYYIHAVEESVEPQRALVSALTLDRMQDQLADLGHLLHTSSHIYLRVGDYQRAVDANQRALAADLRYAQEHGLSGEYAISAVTHDLFFLVMSYLYLECYEQALHYAKQLEAFIAPHVKQRAALEEDLLMSMQVYLYFHRWQEILDMKMPEAKRDETLALWHFARAMAYLSLGQRESAQREKELLAQCKSSTTVTIGMDLLNSAGAKSEGNLQESIEFLRAAVKKQDQHNYLSWYYPIRHTLGAALSEAGCSEEAEAVFRELLAWLPRNGRALFGLAHALESQGKCAYEIERSAKEALNNNILSLKDL